MSIGKHHTRSDNSKDEWLTPQYITNALGPFDLDPCSPIERPWETAKKHLTIKDDGLWPLWNPDDFIWMNPPYGSNTGTWLERLAEQNNGIALVFARTETRMFFEHVWNKAACILFISGRITFYHVDGTPGKFTGGAPSVLIGYGTLAHYRMEVAIERGTIKGKLIALEPGGCNE